MGQLQVLEPEDLRPEHKQLTWKGGKALAHHMGLQELASPLGHCKNIIEWVGRPLWSGMPQKIPKVALG